MRIWVQSNTDLTTADHWKPYLDVLTEHLEDAKDPATELRIEGVGRMVDNITRSPFDRHTNATRLIESAMRAPGEGYDAVVVIGLATLGREPLMEALDIPVVYAQDIAWSFASWLHRSFGLIAHDRAVYFRRRAQIREFGFDANFVPGSYTDVTEHDVVAAFESDNGVLDAMLATTAPTIAGGAQVLVPDINPVGMLLRAKGVEEVDGVPVFDAAGWTLRAAEMCIRAKRAPAKPPW